MDDRSTPTPVLCPAGKRPVVDPGQLRTDISLCLQLAGVRTARDALARKAFKLVAEIIVEHFTQRGYQVTAPDSAWSGPGPQPVFKTSRGSGREG